MRSLQIAGMTVLDRLVVTCHLAGCSPIYIVSENTPRLVRSEALHIEPQITLLARVY